MEQQQVDEMRDNSIEAEENMNDDPICIPIPTVKSIAKKDQIMTIKTCVGQKCYLNQTPKQFYSIGTKKRAGPKKCSQCRTFEPAVKKSDQM